MTEKIVLHLEDRKETRDAYCDIVNFMYDGTYHGAATISQAHEVVDRVGLENLTLVITDGNLETPGQEEMGEVFAQELRDKGYEGPLLCYAGQTPRRHGEAYTATFLKASNKPGSNGMSFDDTLDMYLK